MNSQVFHLHSTLEIPLESVHDYFEAEPEYPAGIDDVEITRRRNTLIISAVATEDSVGKYTPTAQLKATVTETRVYTEEELEQMEQQGPRWGDEEDEDEEPKGELIEMAAFKGDREAVLQNSALQYEMFQVLRDLATEGEGKLTAITARDGELEAIRLVDGEERPATIEVVEDPSGDAAASDGVDWRSNKYIS
jgi:hypothetical protein